MRHFGPNGVIIKIAPDQDLYVAWSEICEMPAGVGTREQALADGIEEDRLDRADKTGTSYHRTYSDETPPYAWGDDTLIAEQRGILRRHNLAEYARLHLDGEYDKAYDLLEPFEDEEEVRR